MGPRILEGNDLRGLKCASMPSLPQCLKGLFVGADLVIGTEQWVRNQCAVVQLCQPALDEPVQVGVILNLALFEAWPESLQPGQ